MIFRFFTMKGGAVLKKPTSPQNGKVQTLEKRIAVQIQNAPRQMGNLACGRSIAAGNHDQIVILIERQPIGIKRPFRLRRRRHQALR